MQLIKLAVTAVAAKSVVLAPASAAAARGRARRAAALLWPASAARVRVSFRARCRGSLPAMVVVSVCSVVLSGCDRAASPEGRDASAAASRGEAGVIDGSFDVGGHKLHMRCQGSGSPTVVYLHGYIHDSSGGGSVNAGAIPDQLATRSRVCVYDRANVGLGDAKHHHPIDRCVERRGPSPAARHRWSGATVRAPRCVLWRAHRRHVRGDIPARRSRDGPAGPASRRRPHRASCCQRGSVSSSTTGSMRRGEARSVRDGPPSAQARAPRARRAGHVDRDQVAGSPSHVAEAADHTSCPLAAAGVRGPL